MLLFCGEPGIGKSTLAQRTAEAAQSRQLDVHWGFAWEAGGAPSYWPWIQVLRSLLTRPGIRDRVAARGDLSMPLARLLPELIALPASSEGLEPGQARFRLLEAVRGALALMGEHAPFVLIVEDLHSADSDSLEMLHYIAQHVGNLPMLLVGTLREMEARASPAMETLWRAARHARVLRPARLNEREVRAYLAHTAKRAQDEDLVRLLLDTTEGNPLFLAEFVDLIGSEGERVLEAGRLPETLAQVIRQHLARIPAAALEMLGMASVLGREFSVAELAAMARRSEADVGTALEPALAAEVIRTIGSERYRFAHILYRDVLHRDLKRRERETLHRRRAEMLRGLIEQGAGDHWTEIATHLQQAGSIDRDEVVEAWRAAARQARERLAFAAAVNALEHALERLGDGPTADPAVRCDLLLELAQAAFVKGDVEVGRRRAADAYRIVRTLDVPALMARAALTYGSAFVAAEVDSELVQYLSETLERLPAQDIADRARVSARLAAARQPASDPSEPMAMARDAIELARKANDEHVLYETLRSAISALMDFAPAEERRELNREYTAVAKRLDDVPEEFRGNLRRMIDACELGDREDMDAAIEACETIARRLDLPHYTWKVLSAQAMQSMIRGQFAAAEKLVDEAEAEAARAEDQSAKMPVAVQRFGLLRDTGTRHAPTIEQLEAEFARLFELLPSAETFVMPRLASHHHHLGDHARARAVVSGGLIERALAGADRTSLCSVGEIALATDDSKLVQTAYDAMVPYRLHCSHWGLMGMVWESPVAYVLAALARYLGRSDEARALLQEALGIAERMQARPVIARIYSRMAEMERDEGDETRARDLADRALGIARELEMAPLIEAMFEAAEVSRPLPGVQLEMELEGDVWRVRFRGESALIKQSRGMQMLHELVIHPEREFHALDLYGTGAMVDPGDTGPALDQQARGAYRERLQELESELAEAEDMGDIGRAEELRQERDLLVAELARAFGLGGRARRSGSAAERARVNVQRRIRDAVKRIGAQLPEAGRFLQNSIKTGTYCSYNPV